MNDTKKLIIKVGLKLFLQKSYKEVTMKELLYATHLSKGAFYHYFESKEQLFKVIVSLFFNLGTIDYSEFPQDSLDQFYHQYVDSVAESMRQLNEYIGGEEGAAPYNYFLILFDALRLFPEFLEMEQKQYHQDLKAWELVIGRAKRKKEIRSKTPDQELARLFLYTTDGVLIRYVNNPRKEPYPAVLLEALDAQYAGLKA